MDRNFLNRLKAIVPGWATYDYLPPFRKEKLLIRRAELETKMDAAWKEHHDLRFYPATDPRREHGHELSEDMDKLDKQMQEIDETIYREKL